MSGLADPRLEADVIAAAVAMGHADLLARRGLRPHHFDGPDRGAVFDAALGVCDRGVDPDPTTVRVALERAGRGDLAAKIDALPGVVPEISAVLEWADRLVELARRRRLRDAAARLARAAEGEDPEALAAALAAVDAGDDAQDVGGQTLSAQEVGQRFLDTIDARPDDPRQRRVPLPLAPLTRAMRGGMRPGHVVVVAGYTSHGKSVLASMLAEHAAEHGARVHAYLTEMQFEEEAARVLARRTGISNAVLAEPARLRELPGDRMAQLIDAAGRYPHGLTEVGDMTVADIARDLRRQRFDVAVLDHLSDFDWTYEHELRGMVETLRRAAKVAGTRLILVAQLNRSATAGRDYPPRPSLASLKGTSALEQKANQVAFVYLEESEDDPGNPGEHGEVRLAKNRGGSLVSVPVRLDPRTVRFVPDDPAALAVAA